MTKTITVYTQPNCQPCRAVKRWLDKRGVEYTTVDVTEDPKIADSIKELGYSGTPVTIVNDGTGDIHFGGFNPDALEAFCTPEAVA